MIHEPYSQLTLCPACGKTIFVTRQAQRDIDPAILAQTIEAAAVDHLQDKHPIRWWLWKRTHKTWALRGKLVRG